MSDLPLVSVIIPTYNRSEKIWNCLNSIISASYKNIEIIVIDNNENNLTSQYIKNNFNYIKIVWIWKNMWASWARSFWAKQAKWEWVLFIDDDNIIDKEMINYLVNDALNYKDVWAISPVMYYLENKNKIWFCWADFNFNTSKPLFFKEIQSKGFYECNAIHNVYMIKKEIWDNVWWLDESLFMWYEEFDLLCKIKQNWYKIWISPSAIDYHDHPINDSILRLVNTPQKAFSTIRNRVIIMKRYANKKQFFIFILLFYPVFIFSYAYFMIREKRFDLLKHHFKWAIEWYKKIFIN